MSHIADRRNFVRILDDHRTDALLALGNLDSDVPCERCETCDDYLPTDWDDEPCEHVWFCEDSGDWSKPGDRCPVGCVECLREGRETRSAGNSLAIIAEGYGMAVEGIFGDEDNGWTWEGTIEARGYGEAATDWWERKLEKREEEARKKERRELEYRD